MSTSSNIQPSIENQFHTNNTQPPSFQPINSIKLVLTENSKITAVSIYPGHAEITCVFEFEVKMGQNQVMINGLPNVLDQDSLRVEGRGAATIHNVTVSNIECLQSFETLSAIKELELKKEKMTKVLKQCKKDWADSLLTLETITPTFGLNIPKLDVWNLSVYKPTPPTPSIEYKFKSPWTFARSASLPAHTIIPIAHSMHESKVTENSFELEALMYHQGLDVMLSSGKGNVSAMFQVPGLITIPSNGATHNVTIVELSLGAVMSWVCVPKKDMKVHLSAKIKNASQYMLLHGTGSVYVDGSFISAPKCLLSALKKALTVPL
ncbi:hypothetical protein C0989_006397, partial [Termitomyces sp. Mn162]